jgi:hypothetical protein
MDPNPNKKPTPTTSNNFNHLLAEADQDAHPPLMQQRNSIFDNLRMSKGEGSSNNNENSTSQNRISQLNIRTNDFIEMRSNQDSRYYYRLGIIDFLQAYTRRK